MQIKAQKTGDNIYPALYHGLSVLFLCLSIAGMVLMAASVPEIIINAPLLILISSVFLAVIYFSNHFSKPVFYIVLGAMVAFCIIYILSDRDAFAAEWSYIFSGFVSESSAKAQDVSHVAMILTLFFALLFFFFDCMLKLHGVSFIISTAFMLIPTIFGYSFPAYAIIPVVIWQLGFFVLPVVYGSRLFSKSDKTQQKIRVKSTLLALVSAAVAVCIALPIAFANSSSAFTRIARMEESALLSMGITPVSMLYNNEGDINRGDNEKTGIVNLQITTDGLPTEALYLRGYFGGNYYGDHWDAPTDDVIFEALSRSSNISDNPDELREIYNSLRYRTTVANKGSDEGAHEISVRNQNINRSVLFYPYNAMRTDDETRNTFNYKYYATDELSVAVSDSDPEELIKLRDLFRDYYADAYDNYTYVTAESVPQLKKLVAENPLNDIEQITEFIKNTLEANAEYTLTPGTAPEGVDVIDYFLFENHKGYCQQFASAAVLMYRLYGVPARYATGFRVTPSAFESEEGEEGYLARISDRSAHAWPEILLPEYGWIPVEVTPSSGQGGLTFIPSGSGLSGDSGAVLVPETEPSTNSSDESDGANVTSGDGEAAIAPGPESEAANGGDTSPGSSSSEATHEKSGVKAGNILPWLLPVCAGAAAVALWFTIRRKKIRDLDDMSFEITLKKLSALLTFADQPVTVKPTDKEFPKQLTKAVPIIPNDEATGVYDIIIETVFGPREITEQNKKVINDLYKKCSDYIISNAPAGRKAVIKYIRMLG